MRGRQALCAALRELLSTRFQQGASRTELERIQAALLAVSNK